jgi:hypothetical protein
MPPRLCACRSPANPYGPWPSCRRPSAVDGCLAHPTGWRRSPFGAGFTEGEYSATLALTMLPVRRSTTVASGSAKPMPNVMPPMSSPDAAVVLSTCPTSNPGQDAAPPHGSISPAAVCPAHMASFNACRLGGRMEGERHAKGSPSIRPISRKQPLAGSGRHPVRSAPVRMGRRVFARRRGP